MYKHIDSFEYGNGTINNYQRKLNTNQSSIFSSDDDEDDENPPKKKQLEKTKKQRTTKKTKAATKCSFDPYTSEKESRLESDLKDDTAKETDTKSVRKPRASKASSIKTGENLTELNNKEPEPVQPKQRGRRAKSQSLRPETEATETIQPPKKTRTRKTTSDVPEERELEIILSKKRGRPSRSSSVVSGIEETENIPLPKKQRISKSTPPVSLEGEMDTVQTKKRGRPVKDRSITSTSVEDIPEIVAEKTIKTRAPRKAKSKASLTTEGKSIESAQEKNIQENVDEMQSDKCHVDTASALVNFMLDNAAEDNEGFVTQEDVFDLLVRENENIHKLPLKKDDQSTICDNHLQDIPVTDTYKKDKIDSSFVKKPDIGIHKSGIQSRKEILKTIFSSDSESDSSDGDGENLFDKTMYKPFSEIDETNKIRSKNYWEKDDVSNVKRKCRRRSNKTQTSEVETDLDANIDWNNLPPEELDKLNLNPPMDKIPKDRDWQSDLDPKFDVYKQLEKVPKKSCIRRKVRSENLPPVKTYKYEGLNKEINYIVDGFSHSTYMRRIIIYLQTITTSFDMIICQVIIPGVNYEANLFGNLQMLLDLFRPEMTPMLTYSIANKNKNHYFESLINQTKTTIDHFILFSITESQLYRFQIPKIFRHFTDDPSQDTDTVLNIVRTKETMFSENFYLFISSMIYGIFEKEIHHGVFKEMLKTFKVAFQKNAEQVLTVE